MNFRVFILTPQNYLLWMGSVICVPVAKGSIPIVNSIIKKRSWRGNRKLASHALTDSLPTYTVQGCSVHQVCLASCLPLWCCRRQMLDIPQSPLNPC